MNKYQVTVIIPIYRPHLLADEIISLKQCFKILNNHKIIFIAPQGLECTEYEGYCMQKLCEFVFFDNSYFNDIHGYNKLMLSAQFYKRFLQYKFILIYQLDAYVFSDQLIHWCKKNYDFIGAPTPPHENKTGEIQFLKTYAKFAMLLNHRVRHVGNGGLSLRKTSTCYWLLKMLPGRVKNWGFNNEDGFFKYWGNLLFPFIKLPTEEEALLFSVETEPAEALGKLQHILPFGCHAFRKYDWEAWRPYIK